MIFDSWKQKRILILGFGREGRSTLAFLRYHFPGKHLFIADQDTSLPQKHSGYKGITWITGAHYLEGIEDYEVIIKSPEFLCGKPKTALSPPRPTFSCSSTGNRSLA
ncbi:MAG: hypothetical protein U5L09_02115 [Bacteroidales bacterium]|nr:hypothetical protein [Bacteroidales bacterium]